MSETRWNKESIADLEYKISNDFLVDFAEYGSKDALYAAIETMSDSVDADIRGYAMDILFGLDRERAVTHLFACLSDPDEAIRAGAIELLGEYGQKYASSLLPLLERDPSPDVRSSAAAMLGYVGNEDAIPLLEQTAADDHSLDLQDCRVSSVAKRAIEQINARTGGTP